MLDHSRTIRPRKSRSPKLGEKKNAGIRGNRALKSLVGVLEGTTHFVQADCPDIAPKKFQAISTSIRSPVDDRLIKEIFALQRFSDVDIAENDTGANACNDKDVCLLKLSRMAYSSNGTIGFTASLT